ncbi:MAG TPA: hypothetical protein VK653_19520 [Xanthobacteraceae bacterium]|nr:hypothetical protein [Xanthobacteraceae bacterium]
MLKNFSLILSVTAALGLGIVASADAKGRGGTMEIQTIRGAPIEHRKHKLAKLVRTPHPGIVLNEHYEGDGEIVFAHFCKLDCEGTVSKRLGSPHRSGRSAYWAKVKNLKAPAVKREAEEDWGG